jgi:hypothetical protein
MPGPLFPSVQCRQDRKLGARVGVQLPHDPADVILDRSLGKRQDIMRHDF